MNNLEMFKRNQRQFTQRLSALEDVGAKQTLLSGQYMINSAGEGFVEVEFPVTFIEKPLVSFGFEMKDGEVYIPGNMAVPTAQVMSWKTREIPPITRHYTGFTIGVVNYGPLHQKMIGIWHASGVALTNPIGG